MVLDISGVLACDKTEGLGGGNILSGGQEAYQEPIPRTDIRTQGY